MQLPRPHFFTSERMVGLVDRPQMVPNEGPVMDTIYGYHTLWIAEVPFIPAYYSTEHKEFDSGAASRISQVWQRQGRFLYDLAQSREHLTTFELRFVSWPQAQGPSQVGIAYLGKVFHEDRALSRHLALELWDKFSAVFPHEAPFSYPLLPVREDNAGQQSRSFAQWYQPLPFDRLTQANSIVELRKYEDWPTIRNIGGTLYAHDYIPHPFVPALDYSALARLFETLTRQRDITIASITLRPQRLTDREVVILHELLGWHQRVEREGINLDNPLVEALREMKSDIFNSYLQTRAKLGSKVYENLVREHRSLFTVRLQVIGLPAAQNDLIESLGSEVMANVENEYPSRWTRVEPATPNELRWARFNAQWLEFARWGISPLIGQAPTIIRLRQLATVAEATGAFRLPVAPGGGGLAGIEVRDEPFGLPAVFHKRGEDFTLGTIQDRGIQTEVPFTLPLATFTKLTHIFGAGDEPRRRVLHTVLREAGKAGIPWTLICGTDTDNAKTAADLTARHITLDAYTSAGAKGCIHPFAPPPGVPLTAFVDALLRVFTTVYQLEPAAAIVLRRALTQAYSEEGERVPGTAISLASLATQLERTLQQDDTPLHLQRAIRTRCLLPLQDLALIAEELFPDTHTQNDWIEPTVVQIGWIGSELHRALLYGCLWAWYTLAFTARPAAQQGIRGLVGIEDARPLFATLTEKGAASSPATTELAQSLAQRGAATVLIDDRPDQLDESVTSRAGAIIVTRSANERAMEKAATIIGASPRERIRLRRLQADEAIIALPGQPLTLITV